MADWARVKALFLDALDHPAAARAAFLESACAGDLALRREVESLLQSDQAAASFCERPAARIIAGLDSSVGEPAEPLALPPGTRLGPYVIEALLGTGGMGEVYRGRDARLDRAVAIKVLPEMARADAERRRRFEREARAISSLTHPHICRLYDIGARHELAYLVMELVEGETLAQRLARGALPLQEALRCGLEIAGALERAHAHGVVHRDLKPANVMLTSDGAKLLDFGLAKVGPGATPDEAVRAPQPAFAPATAPGSLDETCAGAILGTADYLSPEQALGDRIDQRTDIWAFGCVLYEMLAGRRAFPSPAGTVASSGGGDGPDWTALPAATPIQVRDLLARCLDPVPDRRLPEIRLARPALRAATGSAGGRWPPVQAAAVTAIAASLLLAAGLGTLFESADGEWGAGAPRVEAIAVLPLDNLARDPAQEDFGDVLTDALITALSGVGDVRVISRASVMRFKGSPMPVRDIARALNVQSVLQGSVLVDGDRVRITARLIDAATEGQLWADSYERDRRDLPALQADVARAVAREVGARLTPEADAYLAAVRPVDPVAYHAYLRGRQLLNGRTGEGLAQSLAAFQQSIDADPGYAPAYAGLAGAYLYAAGYGFRTPREAMPRAKAAALAGLRVDDRVAALHVALATVEAWYEWRFDAAEAQYYRALSIEPNSSEARHGLARHLMTQGRFDEANQEFTRAARLDPFAPVIHTDRGWLAYSRGDYDAARRAVEESLDLFPAFHRAHRLLGLVSERQGREAEAIAALRRAVELDANPYWISELAFSLARAGDGGLARVRLAELHDLSRTQYVPASARALVYAGLGQHDDAFAWLERAYDERDRALAFLRVYHYWESLQADSRFEHLARRVGLPPVPAATSARRAP